MANRTHVDSNRIPVRRKHRTSKVPRSQQGASNGGAGDDGALGRKAASDAGLGVRDAAAHADFEDARSAAGDGGFDGGAAGRGASGDDAGDTAALDPEAAVDLGDADAGDDADFDDAPDTSRAAELLGSGGEIDEELSEELGVDNIVGPLEAGLGGGLDQAEEALAGITDEEIASRTRQR